MRSSRKQVSSASHSIPEVRFAEHALTSFGGLVVFQAFLQSIDLRARLRASLRHLSSSAAYDFSRIVLLLIVHTLLGWRRLRDLDYYRDDPFVLRVLGPTEGGLSAAPHREGREGEGGMRAGRAQ